MKELKKYIEENKKLLEEAKEKLENTSPYTPQEYKIRQKKVIMFENYIKGLEDALKMIKNKESD